MPERVERTSKNHADESSGNPGQCRPSAGDRSNDDRRGYEQEGDPG